MDASLCGEKRWHTCTHTGYAMSDTWGTPCKGVCREEVTGIQDLTYLYSKVVVVEFRRRSAVAGLVATCLVRCKCGFNAPVDCGNAEGWRYSFCWAKVLLSWRIPESKGRRNDGHYGKIGASISALMRAEAAQCQGVERRACAWKPLHTPRASFGLNTRKDGAELV